MNVEIAERLAARRRLAGLSQEALAEKLGVSRQAVSKWERGEGLPDVYILAQIAQLYGVTVSNLIGEEEPPKKANPHFHIYVLLLSVALYGEAFTATHAILFGFVWTGLILYLISGARESRRHREEEKPCV